MLKPKALAYDRFVLPNGLTVIIYPMPGVLTFMAELNVRVGASFEKRGQFGISHFIEHIAFQGTKKFPTTQALSQAVENLGGTYNAVTYRFVTEYWVKLPHTNFENGLDLLYELVFAPRLDPDNVEREKQIIIAEHNDFWRDPDNRFGVEGWRKRFAKKAHPYTNIVFGKPQTVQGFTKEHISSWRRRYYTPSNMVLTLAGNIDAKKVRKLIRGKFAKLPKGEMIPYPKVATDGYSDFLLFHKNDRKKQIRFSLSFPAFGDFEVARKKRMTLSMLTYAFGGGTTSRLYDRLREQERLVYRINAGQTGYHWLGIVWISGSTAQENLLKALGAIKEEIDRFVTDGTGKAELERTRRFFNAQTLMQFDNPERITSYFASQEADEEEIWLPERYIKEGATIKKKDIDSLARQIFDFSRVNISLQGDVPREELEKVKKLFRP